MKKKKTPLKAILTKLKTGRPSARKLETVSPDDRSFVVKYLPTVGGVWVRALNGDRFDTPAEARTAAKATQEHFRQTGKLIEAR